MKKKITKSKLRKLKSGDFAYKKDGVSVSISKRPHGGWATQIRVDKPIWYHEGYFGKSLPTLNDVLKYINSKIDAT